MGEITVRVDNRGEKAVESGITSGQAMAELGVNLSGVLAAMVNDELVDLAHPVDKDAGIRPVTFEDPEGRRVYWHSAAHLLAQAVLSLYPGAQLGFGPATKDGFYYDFDSEHKFVPEDLEKIEAEMQRLASQNLELRRLEMSRDDAIAFMKEKGQSYKVEHLSDLEVDRVSFYEQGDFVDLCAGPHLQRTGALRFLKLTSLAGAYWKDAEGRPMLQRIYGIAFPTKEDLDAHVERLEKARQRDHRRVGPALDIFSFHPEAGAGLVYWHPKGTRILERIEDFWKTEHRKRGYDLVRTPHISRGEMWEKSGHYEFYRENMYSLDIDGVEYAIKPMNCVGHILIYKTQIRSYRDLPMRFAELGTVYRYERSGVLQGLLRVRGFTQDDAHIFCTPDQIQDELAGVFELTRFMLDTFGFKECCVELSVRDPANRGKYAGSDEMWEKAEAALCSVLGTCDQEYERAEGEAVFYGPKIDVKIVDALGHLWQGPTIQFDFNLPERLDVTYVGPDGGRHPVLMIHRTVLGSMERFMGTLLEHYGGDFPLWLAPTQARLLPIREEHVPFAQQVAERLRQENLDVDIDASDEKVGYKIRKAEMEHVPYMLVVGGKEVESDQVSVRKRKVGDQGQVPVGELAERLAAEVASRM
ncbi:MAG: threonine--tRNA ligase [Candidatus Eisenbacteria sp.]|nr:threonine--tRNA ligase [Candidatus Eisenbacteria bacterium]